MSLHSLLESIPVGVELLSDQVLLVNKHLHMIVEAVTAAATFMHYTKGSVLCLDVYAAMTPVGALFGVSVATFDGQVADTVNLFLVSISVGLIYFICLTESLGAVIHSEECGMGVKFVIMIVLFFVMYGFSIAMFPRNNVHIVFYE